MRAAPRHAGLSVLLLAACLPARGAEKHEPLEAEFLEYLASLEDAEDDWTIVERTTVSENQTPLHKQEQKSATSGKKPPPEDKSR